MAGSRGRPGRNEPLAALPRCWSDEIEVGVIVEDDCSELLGGRRYPEASDLAAHWLRAASKRWT